MSIDQIITNLRRLERDSIAAVGRGLQAGAGDIEATAQATTAYDGMSGATRAATIAYVVGAGLDEGTQADAAYTAAAGLLTGFTGHAGQPMLVSIPGPNPDVAEIVLTVPTDYILDLETERAGEKAFIADALIAGAPGAFDAVVRALGAVWRR